MFMNLLELVILYVRMTCVFANTVVKGMLGLWGGWEGVVWIHLDQNTDN